MAIGKQAAQGAMATLARLIDKAVSLLSGFLAAALILYGGYALYDNWYIQSRAYGSTNDLIQYRPSVIDGNSVKPTSALAQKNDDYRGWLTLYETEIDYPVMQGKDDLYYASHDVFKKSSLTGALYFAAENSSDGSDSYNMIYGHHMDANALFGGLDSFVDAGYFDSHRKGVLVTKDGTYDLRVFAVTNTDAYNSTVYSVGNRDLAGLIAYIRENNVRFDEASARGAKRILALSTCEDAETNGRLVVFVSMVKRDKKPVDPVNPNDPAGSLNPPAAVSSGGASSPTAPTTPAGVPEGPKGVPDVPAVPKAPEAASAPTAPGSGDTVNEGGSPLASLFRPSGISYGRDAWALVNLICLIITMYLLVPLGHLKAKFRRHDGMRAFNEEKGSLQNALGLGEKQLAERERIYREAYEERGCSYDDAARAARVANAGVSMVGAGADVVAEGSSAAFGGPVTEPEFATAVEHLYYHVRDFARRLRIGTLVELVIFIIALVTFILTEDMRLPMILIDEWTPVMIALLLACWVVDMRLARYRGNVPEEEDDGGMANGVAAEA